VDSDIRPGLRCRAGDVALVVRGVWAGMVADVLAYEWAPPGFDWIVRSRGDPFPFGEFGLPESVMARARDDYLEPLRPDPECAADDLALYEPSPLVAEPSKVG
jgi:hypothetical protein